MIVLYTTGTSAHILGIDAASISYEPTKQKIYNILKQNLNDSNSLVEAMCERIEGEYKEKFDLLFAFANGFRQ